MSDETNSVGSNQNQDFDLDDFIASLVEEPAEANEANYINSPSGLDDDFTLELEDSDPNPDLGATLSYEAVGESYPELPFATYTNRSTDPLPDEPPAINPEDTAREIRTAVTSRASRGLRTSQIAANNQEPEFQENGYALASTMTSAGAGAAANAVAPLREGDFYRIRGGGSERIKSPLISIILALVIIAGIFFIGFALYNLLGKLATPVNTQVITLTPEQTRNAIDTNMPLLSDIVQSDFDLLQNGYTEQGMVVFANNRYISDSPDPSAVGRELVRMPAQATEEYMTGFYEGGYSAYSPEELQNDFNGAWTLDMTRGDKGSLFKLKYVNLNAQSIAAEMDHLVQLQGMSGEGSTVVAQGSDSRGNTVRQGTRAVGEVIYYWKVAACPFNEVYTAKKIGSSSVYISITVSTYDFYTGDPDTPK
jgi:hypothetical protein